MNDRGILQIPRKEKLIRLFALFGLAGIVLFLVSGNWTLFGAIVFLPIGIIALFYMLQYPVVLFFLFFTCNYFIMGISRYLPIDGIGVFVDILLVALLVILFIHGALTQTVPWKQACNLLTAVTLIWMFYCIAELANPTGMMKAWILSRGLIFNGFLISVVTALCITRFRQVQLLIFLYATFTLLAVGKVFMQRYMGFDAFENRWLSEGGALTHLIHSGTRYFSFFTDAGNFGSNMGCAGILLGIVAFYIPNKALKIYYLLISLGAVYAMFLSGTRGAVIVPLGGLALYTLISKNYKAMTAGGLSLILIYVFFAFTHIGESNGLIRRMRSAFNPSKDASFNVRKENQKKLAAYLKNKPFGEGLGLSGGENRKISVRFTTQIPNDSWYVKIWVETGIVGLIIYLGGLIAVLIKSVQIIMFKIKDKELRGILSGLICGVFGLMLSAYGNPIWGQYPTMILAFVFLTLAIKGESFDIRLKSTTKLI